MQKVFLLFLMIAVPMAAVELIYRLFDRNDRLTNAVTNKLGFLKTHKYAFQIGGALGFVIVFGLIGFFVKMKLAVYFGICGAVLGLINGISVGIMHLEDENR